MTLNPSPRWVYTGVCACALLLAWLPARAKSPPLTPLLAHGRYLAVVGGCNDCHTAGYAEAGGRIPQKEWMAGTGVGWHGPWGTTYPPNLRLFMQTLTLRQWIHYARTANLRPPMPYWALRIMSVHDLTALYAFIRFLGPIGKPAPAYLPPGKMPHAPYVTYVTSVSPPKPQRTGASHGSAHQARH